MQTSSFTVFILSLLLCLSKGVDGNRLDDQDIDSDDGIRIIGGKPAGRIPYYASLRNGNGRRHFCGGAIINSRTILTAARCAERRNTESVVVGTNLLNIKYGGYKYDIETRVIHPRYNPNTSANDIALLITEKNITFGVNVGSISLPAENSTLPDDMTITATGWGRTDESSEKHSSQLQALRTRTISLQNCRNYWQDIILNTNICVHGEPGRGLCADDSGGPVVARQIIHGVISFGQPCAVGVPDVLTRVASFVPWIRSNLVK